MVGLCELDYSIVKIYSRPVKISLIFFRIHTDTTIQLVLKNCNLYSQLLDRILQRILTHAGEAGSANRCSSSFHGVFDEGVSFCV